MWGTLINRTFVETKFNMAYKSFSDNIYLFGFNIFFIKPFVETIYETTAT